MKLKHKLIILSKRLKQLESVAVAFSGGVDSSFLLAFASNVLGKKNILAVTVKSFVYPESELQLAEKIISSLKIPWKVISVNPLKNKDFKQNPINKCYFCKKIIFNKIAAIAKNKGYKNFIDGTNFDDSKDYRPGSKAAIEAGTISPLKEAKLTKKEIRTLSKKMGLLSWNFPSNACLATRIALGEEITPLKLKKIERAENALKIFGFNDLRVRLHNDIARIEIIPADFKKFMNSRIEIISILKRIGFSYLALDLEGYRTGSMNKIIKRK